MENGEFYRNEIIKIIGSVKREDVLKYLYVFINAKLKGVPNLYEQTIEN